jgi:uncharacterized protein (DUF305 family)
VTILVTVAVPRAREYLPRRPTPRVEQEASGSATKREAYETKAFIDSMMPHHAGAIQMATVALQRSDIEQVRTMSRGIIDAQAEEIGKMIDWRKTWYGSQQ